MNLKKIILSVVIIFFIVVGISFYKHYRADRNGVYCYFTLNSLHKAFMQYADTNDGKLPLKENWFDDIASHYEPYTLSYTVNCCGATDHKECSYIYNGNLSGISIDSIKEPDKTILLFESITDGYNQFNMEFNFSRQSFRHFGRYRIMTVGPHNSISAGHSIIKEKSKQKSIFRNIEDFIFNLNQSN